MARSIPLFLASMLVVGLTAGAKAGPVDTFDIDILTASRHGLDQVRNYRPCSERGSLSARAACEYRAETPARGF